MLRPLQYARRLASQFIVRLIRAVPAAPLQPVPLLLINRALVDICGQPSIHRGPLPRKNIQRRLLAPAPFLVLLVPLLPRLPIQPPNLPRQQSRLSRVVVQAPPIRLPLLSLHLGATRVPFIERPRSLLPQVPSMRRKAIAYCPPIRLAIRSTRRHRGSFRRRFLPTKWSSDDYAYATSFVLTGWSSARSGHYASWRGSFLQRRTLSTSSARSRRPTRWCWRCHLRGLRNCLRRWQGSGCSNGNGYWWFARRHST